MSSLVIKKQLVSNTPHKWGRANRKLYITVHDTGNTNVGADAQAHANIQSRGNSRAASWHWSVDDKEAIQSFTHDFQLWHAGDGKGNGGLNSIGIEICINSDGNYRKAVENAAALVRHICDTERIPYDNIRQHWHWSRKDCPRQIRAGRDGINWSRFISMVKSPGKPAVSTPSKPVSSNPVKKPVTGSITDLLKSKGQDSSFAARAKLAAKYGIKGYSGTASQNLALYNHVLGESAAKPASKPVAKPGYTSDGIRKGMKLGEMVTVKKSAKKYATGEPIAEHVKGKSYKIIQLETKRALLSGINSWVNKTDLD